MKTETGNNIRKAGQLLKAGEVVAIPTETVYGLAGNALNEDAVLKIFQIKNRPHFDPLIVHFYSIERSLDYIKEFPDPLLRLAKEFTPGPLTFILPKKERIPDLVTSGQPTVGIRFPSHPLTRDLLRDLDFPLAAPSANPFKYVSPTTASHVFDQLQGKLPYILDGGPCEIGVESTIITYSDNKVIILRLGGIAVEDIEKIAGEVEIRSIISDNPIAPGQLESHYAPVTPLTFDSPEELLEDYRREEIGGLWFTNPKELLLTENQRVLSPAGDSGEAAKNLFRHIRELDRLNLKVIATETLPDTGLGKAINDRIKRATAKSN